MIEPITAQYRELSLAKYRDNPLIESLPAPLTAGILMQRTMALPRTPTNLASHTRLERKMLAEDIGCAFVTPQLTLRLYEEVYIRLCEGYLARNPLVSKVQQSLHRIRDPFSAPLPGAKTSAASSLFIGPTGLGKTAVVRSVFSQFPVVISHTQYRGHPLLLKQIVYLKIDCPSNGSRLAFINNIWHALDIALGTHYHEQYSKARLKIPDLQKCIAAACAMHAVGFLVVDEVHYLRPVLEDNDKEQATLPFVDELLNGIGIPVLLIGTWKSARLLNRNATTVRRASSALTLAEKPYPLTSKYWEKLVDELWAYQVCLQPAVLNDEWRQRIHHFTCGLPALLVKLLIAAQKRAIDTGKDTVDGKILEEVYQREFVLLHEALNALRHGHHERYEDLLPCKWLDEIAA